MKSNRLAVFAASLHRTRNVKVVPMGTPRSQVTWGIQINFLKVSVAECAWELKLNTKNHKLDTKNVMKNVAHVFCMVEINKEPFFFFME